MGRPGAGGGRWAAQSTATLYSQVAATGTAAPSCGYRTWEGRVFYGGASGWRGHTTQVCVSEVPPVLAGWPVLTLFPWDVVHPQLNVTAHSLHRARTEGAAGPLSAQLHPAHGGPRDPLTAALSPLARNLSLLSTGAVPASWSRHPCQPFGSPQLRVSPRGNGTEVQGDSLRAQTLVPKVQALRASVPWLAQMPPRTRASPPQG